MITWKTSSAVWIWNYLKQRIVLIKRSCISHRKGFVYLHHIQGTVTKNMDILYLSQTNSSSLITHIFHQTFHLVSNFVPYSFCFYYFVYQNLKDKIAILNLMSKCKYFSISYQSASSDFKTWFSQSNPTVNNDSPKIMTPHS